MGASELSCLVEKQTEINLSNFRHLRISDVPLTGNGHPKKMRNRKWDFETASRYPKGEG
jgi:hypothetical protein